VYLTDITNVKISNLLLYILNGKSLFFAITVFYLSFRKKLQSTFVIRQEDANHFCHFARRRSRNRNLLQRRQKQKCSVGSRSIQSQSFLLISQEAANHFCHFARSRNPLLSFRKKLQSTFVISQEDTVEIEISCTAGRSRSVQLAVAVFSRSRSLSFRKKPQTTFVISQEDAVEIEISCTAGCQFAISFLFYSRKRTPFFFAIATNLGI
jgi:hypothetical protein